MGFAIAKLPQAGTLLGAPPIRGRPILPQQRHKCVPGWGRTGLNVHGPNGLAEETQ